MNKHTIELTDDEMRLMRHLLECAMHDRHLQDYWDENSPLPTGGRNSKTLTQNPLDPSELKRKLKAN